MSFADCCRTFLASRQSTSRGTPGRSGASTYWATFRAWGSPRASTLPDSPRRASAPQPKFFILETQKDILVVRVFIHLITLINVISCCAVLVYYTANHDATVNPTKLVNSTMPGNEQSGACDQYTFSVIFSILDFHQI